jgi:hypothetical protein
VLRDLPPPSAVSDNAADASPRIGDVAREPRDKVNVGMINRLPCSTTDVQTYIEALSAELGGQPVSFVDYEGPHCSLLHHA